MNYPEHFAKHVRIAILRALAEAPSCKANSSILYTLVDELGLSCTRDQIKVQIAWLAEQGLVSSVELSGLVVATLTERGADVAAGRAVAPGVQRPTPRG